MDGSYEGTVSDGAGEIGEVGQEVQKFKVGDKVVAILPYGVSILKMPSFTYKIHVFVTKCLTLIMLLSRYKSIGWRWIG